MSDAQSTDAARDLVDAARRRAARDLASVDDYASELLGLAVVGKLPETDRISVHFTRSPAGDVFSADPIVLDGSRVTVSTEEEIAALLADEVRKAIQSGRLPKPPGT